MSITKILAKHAQLDVMINYVLNGDKTTMDTPTTYFKLSWHNPFFPQVA